MTEPSRRARFLDRPCRDVGLALCLLGAPPGAVAGEPVAVPVGADGVQRVEMVGGNYFFRPDHIVVKANLPVEIGLRKEAGIAPHTFVLRVPEEGIDIDLELGAGAKPVRFTIRTPGRYAFHCRNRLLFFESHRDKGMHGVIEVVER